MGFNFDELRDPIVVDIETGVHPCAVDFIEKPDLESIQAAKNLKDPAKIAEDIARRKADAQAEHDAKLGRAALDWNVSRIVALAWSVDHGETVIVKPCANEEEEAMALVAFWKDAERRQILGFCARNFDVPTLIQRSRLLNVAYRAVNLARFGKGSVIDLRDILTFDDARYEALMPRSLKAFCRRFGLEVSDPVDGKDIGQLLADANWDGIIAHVTSDVRLTAALARRIGVLTTETAGVL
jgi:hypothetical protein